MPKRKDIKKIMVIGSGPIIIGQAAEFDYSGTQACKALREEGYKVVLVNSNPATIMTDPDMADAIYIEPLTPEILAEIIRKEKPDGLLPTIGGQTGLNLAVAVDKLGVLKDCNVKVLGTSIKAIQDGEDRQLFKDLMKRINEPIPKSKTVNTVEGAKEFVKKNGEFTVNIALIKDNTPILGVVYVPVKDLVYYGDENGSFKETGVHYLDWTITYLTKTRTAREIIVVVGWEGLLEDINYTVNQELVDLILESRKYLLELLTNISSWSIC